MKAESTKTSVTRLYLTTWVRALRVLLGWSKARTLKWAQNWEEDLKDPSSAFFKKSPGYYFLDLVIPGPLKNELSKSQQESLKGTLLDLIESSESFRYYQNPKFDWKLAKRRVEALIRSIKRAHALGGSVESILCDCNKRMWQTEVGRYRRTWVKALRVLLDWPVKQALEWTRKWEPWLDSDDPIRQGRLRNETPLACISILLVPKHLEHKLSTDEKYLLREALLSAIDQGDSLCILRPNFDWISAKKRVEGFLVEVEANYRTSKGRIRSFLLKDPKRFIKKPTKRQKERISEILEKTFVQGK